MTLLPDLLALASGGLVGFSLGLVGGGGSILAVPLLVYAVGISNPHLAIGTSAVAVSANAAINLIGHARAGSVKWPCATVFAGAGVAGALVGAFVGRQVDGERLLALFAVLMVVVGVLMLRRRAVAPGPEVRLNRQNLPKLLGLGLATGLLSGFFGIGGGFLIVPGLVMATGMSMFNAMASSLVAVTSLGLATAGSYAAAGLVDWRVAAIFIAGGAIGGLFGRRLSRVLSRQRGMLDKVFAALIFVVAGYMLIRNLDAF